MNKATPFLAVRKLVQMSSWNASQTDESPRLNPALARHGSQRWQKGGTRLAKMSVFKEQLENQDPLCCFRRAFAPPSGFASMVCVWLCARQWDSLQSSLIQFGLHLWLWSLSLLCTLVRGTWEEMGGSGFLFVCLLVSKFLGFTKFPFHVFWQILVPSPRISRFHSTDLRDCSVHVFSKIVTCLDFEHFEIYKIAFVLKVPGILLISFRYLVSRKIKTIGFGGSGYVHRSLNHRNEEFRALS